MNNKTETKEAKVTGTETKALDKIAEVAERAIDEAKQETAATVARIDLGETTAEIRRSFDTGVDKVFQAALTEIDRAQTAIDKAKELLMNKRDAVKENMQGFAEVLQVVADTSESARRTIGELMNKTDGL